MPQVQSSYRDAFQSGESFATTLVIAVVDHFGTECFEWLPETLKLEIEADFQAKIPNRVFDRLMTGINLVVSDAFYKNLPDFNEFANILSGDTYDPRAWEPADAAEVAWAITEAMLLAEPDEDDENPFSDEIVAYIGAALDAEGIISPPDVLKIAVRESNPAALVQSDFSDDPTMFNAIYDLEASKTEEINRLVKENLIRMSQQLDQLQLRNGNAKDVVNNMLRSFEQK